MLHALAGTGARILVVERGDVRAAGRRQLGSGGGVEGAALPHHRAAGSTATASRSGRTRTTASAATRSSGAACSTGCAARTSARCSTPTASRRRGRSTTTRWRRTTTAAERLYHVHGAGRRRSRPKPPRAPVSRIPPVPHAPRHGGDRRRSCAALGLHPSPLPLGLDPAGRGGRLPAVQHVQLVSVPHPRQERRRRAAACARRSAQPNVTLLDRRAARRG